MTSSLIIELLRKKPVGMTVEVNGWLRTRRDSKQGFSFLEINDGSCLASLQVIADGKCLPNYDGEVLRLTTGCSIRARGILADSPAAGQEVELRAASIEILGWSDPQTYPLQKKRHSFEFLRTIAHLRPRTNSIGAVHRLRSSVSLAIHQFFNHRHFHLVHTPIITTSDCEGAGEVFRISAPLQGGRPEDPAPQGHDATDFFGRPANLTVSGQLQAEAFALSLGRVYTFGPTFRAENSNTSRHLAEFWMIEPEMAFCDLKGIIDLAEQFLQELINHVLNNCQEDLALFDRHIAPGLIKRLDAIQAQPFLRISYTEAVNELKKSGRDFTYPVAWGHDLQSEHERFLTEEIYHHPVVVSDYPVTIKPFYMRANDDGKTVAAMDILFPGIGEIVGGSQREERLQLIEKRMAAAGLPLADYQWYLDLRRYGTAPHAGFGLGLERFLQFVTGMGNIRDVIAFPRTPGAANY